MERGDGIERDDIERAKPGADDKAIIATVAFRPPGSRLVGLFASFIFLDGTMRP